MARYDAVIFDLDGTLVDSAPGIGHSLLEAIRLVLPERSMGLTDIREYIGPPLPDMVALLFPDATPELANRIESQFRVIYDDTGWQQTNLHEYAVDTLQWLVHQRIVCFLVTNKRLKPTRQILGRFGLLPLFEEVVSSDANHPVLQSKEAMVRYLVKKYVLEPARTLMVGDTVGDAMAARVCGMSFAVAAFGYGEFETDTRVQADYVLHSLSGLRQIVSAAD